MVQAEHGQIIYKYSMSSQSADNWPEAQFIDCAQSILFLFYSEVVQTR